MPAKVTVTNISPTFVEPIEGSGKDMPINELRERMKVLWDSGDCSVPWESWEDTEETIRSEYGWIADEPQSLIDYLKG